MAGPFGWVQDILSGGTRNVTDPANQFFGPESVGGSWAAYLQSLYATPTADTPQYRSQSTALRDTLSRETSAAQNQLGLASNSGGIYDSGARLAGLGDINRTHMAAYSQGLSSILSKLESDKMSAAYPFLQARIGAYDAYQRALGGAESAANQRYMQASGDATSITNTFLSGGMGSMGG